MRNSCRQKAPKCWEGVTKTLKQPQRVRPSACAIRSLCVATIHTQSVNCAISQNMNYLVLRRL